MKKLGKCLAVLTAVAMMSPAAAFAAAPSEYDGQSYESLGYTSEDSDGQFDLAVIANGDVILGEGATVLGSIYSAGDIYATNGMVNHIDGLFISGTEGTLDPSTVEGEPGWQCDGYIHVDKETLTTDGITSYSSRPEYFGAVKDTATSFDYSYTPYIVPDGLNEGGDIDANPWNPGTVTVSESTHYGTVNITADGLAVDTTAGDVTVVIDNLNVVNGTPYIKIKGDNKLKLYINNIQSYGTDTDAITLNLLNESVDGYDWRLFSQNEADYLSAMENMGDPEKVDLYVNSNTGSVNLTGGMIAANIYSNAPDRLTLAGSSKTLGSVETGAEEFVLTGGTAVVKGNVCAPNADAKIIGAATLRGQLIADNVRIASASVLYKADGTITTQPETEEPPVIEPDDPPVTESYDSLGARVIYYDVKAGSYSIGRIKLTGHTPVGDEYVGIHYTVLDENTYYETDEELSEDEWNEAVRRVNIIQEVSEGALQVDVSPESWHTFGRIDSNGYRDSLSVTPKAYKKIWDRAGHNMYLCIGDGDGNVNHVLMLIDETVQYDDVYEGNISPYVYDFSSQGFKSFK